MAAGLSQQAPPAYDGLFESDAFGVIAPELTAHDNAF